MKEGEEEKTKTYSALIWTDKAIRKEDIAFLDDIKVSVALFANLCSTCPGALGESLYTCSHGHISFSGFVFFLHEGFSCCRDFHISLPPSRPSLLHHCHPSVIAGWLLAKATNS